MLSTRDQEIVLARDRGDTTIDLGRRFGLSHQRVSVVMNRATAIVDRLDLSLMVARRTGEVVVYVVPHGPDYSLAVDFGFWLIKRLRDRGMQLDIETRRATDGLVLLLTDSTPRRAS